LLLELRVSPQYVKSVEALRTEAAARRYRTARFRVGAQHKRRRAAPAPAIQDQQVKNPLDEEFVVTSGSMTQASEHFAIEAGSVACWMATDFSVQVACKVTDAGGQAITTVSSAGAGKATSSELLKNFSIAGQRASQDALIKLRESLLQSADLRK
jgi:hypothetical protein